MSCGPEVHTGPPADIGPLHVASDGRTWIFAPSHRVLVGRDPGCDITLADERVSREHLEVRPEAHGWVVSDLRPREEVRMDGSGPGATVLQPACDLLVRVGDADGPELLLRCPSSGRPGTARQVVVIGHSTAPSPGGAPDAADRTGAPDGRQEPTGGAHDHRCLDARHLTVTTAGGATLLDDVSVTLPAGCVTAVIGPSGAGKSTLVSALTGARPANRGEVSWAGRDLYAEYDELRLLVGLVPQEDIVHRQLTVDRALGFAARLRLPPHSDLGARVDAVLDEVRLRPQRGQRIDELSGGQLKRTSIALELLTAPQLLFLDEPTSGLDPGLDRQVMVELRALAGGGRVVVVVTHSVLALDVCDRVLVLAPGGRVAFCGPREELLPFFEVQDYPAVFSALEDPAWVRRHAQSSARAALAGRSDAPAPTPVGATPVPRRPAALRQLATLVRRNLAVAAADRMLLVLLVTMPVVLAAMAHAFPGDAGLSVRASGGDTRETQQRLLVLVVGAALMGAALSVRELVVERPIYRREHAVGLHPAVYLASKVAVLGSLVATQAVVFTLLALWGIHAPDTARVLPSARLELAAAVAAVAVAMTVAGLAVSAAARSVDQTMPGLVGLVMAQLVLCGGLFPLAGSAGLEQVSWLLPARFGYAAGAATIGLQPASAPGGDPLLDPTAHQWLLDMGALGLQTAALVGVAVLLVARSVVRTSRR